MANPFSRSAALFALALLPLLTAAAGKDASMTRFENVVDKMVAAYNAGDFAGMRSDYNKAMEEALTREKAEDFFGGLSVEHGKIKKLGSARMVPPDQALFPAFFERGALDIRLVLDGENKVAGLMFVPHTPEIPVPERHATPLAPPFQGRWLVFWGGDAPEQNQHHALMNQKFAFDLLGVDEKGQTHKGEGAENDDYFAFGREVLAPGDGIVKTVIEGVPDNVPGSMNPFSALGNAVFIEHRVHEVSVLAHLKLGSVRVKLGEKVRRGQEIGLCGNSGNSSEPHLHYHLQNTPVIQDGTGIKVRFDKVVVTQVGRTEPRSDYSPVKGDIISPR